MTKGINLWFTPMGVSLLLQETGGFAFTLPDRRGGAGHYAPGPLLLVRPEGFMRHDWIFDVLSDLHDYACRNDLPELARHVEETLVTARREIDAETEDGGEMPQFIRRRAH